MPAFRGKDVVSTIENHVPREQRAALLDCWRKEELPD